MIQRIEQEQREGRDEQFKESEQSIVVVQTQAFHRNSKKIYLGAACILLLLFTNIAQYFLYLSNGQQLSIERKTCQQQKESLKQQILALSKEEYSKRVQEKRRQSKGKAVAANGTVSAVRLLGRDWQGKRIEYVLYSDQERRTRIEFNNHRMTVIDNNKHVESLRLSKFTLKIDGKLDKEEVRVDGEEYERIRRLHGLDRFVWEIPMCVVVPGFNNKANFRLQYNLNSVFLQNYSNYFVVVINDGSTDGSNDLFLKYFNFYQIDQRKYVYINNKQRRSALENIYLAVTEYCSQDSVVVNLDGDDELIGKNVLKIFNAHYQDTKMGVIYSNYIRYHKDNRFEGGWTKQYPQNVKQERGFRASPQHFSHLKTHRASLFREIPLKELQDDKGAFYTITSDMAVYYPLMELSCGKVLKIEGYHYLYNFNTGLNDYTVNHKEQVAVEARVRGGKKLQCATNAMKDWN